ncbi:MAG TPA: zinc ABC transporter substrate-binding protein [Blastococcus sp.]|nr:zinc ABC transporter substrate-binding protein [Blastococcus sp.]
MPSARRAALAALLAVIGLVGVSACSTTNGPKGAVVHSADPAACPGKVVDVVVSIGQWGDIADRLGGACASVTTVLASANVDPHDFEPGTAAIAAFSNADLVVLNGAGYDQWAADATAQLDPRPAVLSAAAVAHAPAGGANPHLWYDPGVVQGLASALTARLSALSPGAAGYFAERQAAWTRDLQPYLAAITALRGVAAGKHYAATETVFDRMAAAAGLADATPPGYRRSSSNGSDPAPGDLVAFRTALADHTVDVLIYNTQTSGSVPDQLRADARAAGVPVVPVTESPPVTGGSFLAWQTSQLQRLTTALGTTR